MVVAAGRALGAAIAGLIGALDVRQIMIVGSVTAARRAVVRRGPRRGRPAQPGPARRDTRIVDGGTGEDVTLLGACALLMTRELGLTVHR